MLLMMMTTSTQLRPICLIETITHFTSLVLCHQSSGCPAHRHRGETMTDSRWVWVNYDIWITSSWVDDDQSACIYSMAKKKRVEDRRRRNRRQTDRETDNVIILSTLSTWSVVYCNLPVQGLWWSFYLSTYPSSSPLQFSSSLSFACLAVHSSFLSLHTKRPSKWTARQTNMQHVLNVSQEARTMRWIESNWLQTIDWLY